MSDAVRVTTLDELSRLFIEAQDFADGSARVAVRVGPSVFEVGDLAYTDGVFYIELAGKEGENV